MPNRGDFSPNIIRIDDLFKDGLPPLDDPAMNDYQILAEGDSWFTLGHLPPITNLLQNLRFNKLTAIVNCATPTHDIIPDMANHPKTDDFEEVLRPRAVPWTWDLILLSGGGNDFFSAAERTDPNKGALIKPANNQSQTNLEDYCYVDNLNSLINNIQKAYRKLAGMRHRDGNGKLTPIVVHTYDYATPRDAPAVILGIKKGPWLHKAFEQNQIPNNDRVELGRMLNDRLAEGILAITDIENFHVVDTRNTLSPASSNDLGNTAHWLNEIHPNADGYDKLAKERMEPVIHPLLTS